MQPSSEMDYITEPKAPFNDTLDIYESDHRARAGA